MRHARRHHPSPLLAVLLPLALLAGACSGDGSRSSSPAPEAGAEVELAGTMELTVADPAPCDPLDEAHCLLPFPNDAFTVADDATDTGRRVALPAAGMPANQDGVGIDPTEWNRNDGFSPGSAVLTLVPGLDLEQTGAAPIDDIARSLDPDAPILLLDADTGERHPYWAELDANATAPGTRALMVRPAVNLEDGHRYVVALRDLRDGAGEPIPAGPAFRAYRDRLETPVPEVEERREHMDGLLEVLEDAGVDRDDLYLAWDFTVASTRNLTERMLRLRDDAFAALGDAAPTFTVTGVQEDVDEHVARRVDGTFRVPLYLTDGGAPGSRLTGGPDGLPERVGEYTASFACIVPRGEAPFRASLYGHGLLGSRTQVGHAHVALMAHEHGFVFCATDWIGMSEEDVPNAVAVLQELSGFPSIPDRLQQGVLNTLFLGRLMVHEQGLVSDPAFQAAGGPAIDTSDLFYDGNSQGGIMGGMATAVAQDWTRAVLGVPGMNYGLLLRRSTDFDQYALILEPAYPDELGRTLALSLIQMLWDRGETNGYANHLTDDPLPGTPEHDVLLHVAFGDFQVTTYAADVEARTIGARVHQPALAPGRSTDVEPYWGIPAVDGYPFDGSAMVVWDSGTPAPPLTNTPPRDGRDPHEDPRFDAAARRQKSEFLRTGGVLIDVCDGAPCTAAPVDTDY